MCVKIIGTLWTDNSAAAAAGGGEAMLLHIIQLTEGHSSSFMGQVEKKLC